VWWFNPYFGTPRDAGDVNSDPRGLALVPPGATLRAYIERATATESKPTNPKDAIGGTKLPLHLVSPIIKAYQAIAHYLGNVKYGAWNYVAGGARASVYKAACDRHMDAWWAGEEFDPADGTPHLANALACIGILIECSEAGNLQDDRPPSTRYTEVRAKLEPIMARILKQHGDKAPRHWTIADNAEIAEARK
jgi:hypothetical protein